VRGMIMSIAYEFAVSFIPTIQTAGVVPTITNHGAGLEPWRVIDVKDVVQIATNIRTGSATTTLRAYGITAQGGHRTISLSTTQRERKLIGYADIWADQETSGQWTEFGPEVKYGEIRFEQAPSWIIGDVLDTNATMRPNSGIPEASNPVPTPAVRPPNYAGFGFGDASELYNHIVDQGFGDRYAKTRLLDNIFRYRRGIFSGALRFDIAPGSFVKLEGIDTPFTVETVDGRTVVVNPNVLYGDVSSVRITIDATANIADTTFVVNNLMTEYEQQSPTLTTNEHPLYDQVWIGCPLLEELDR